MIPVLFLLLLALAALAGMAAGGVSYEKKLRRRVAGQFGRRPEEDYPLEDIPAYCQLDPAPAIDHTTWADLDMDLVFRRLNSCQSSVGEQVLYAQLHRLSPPDHWEELLAHLESRPQEREGSAGSESSSRPRATPQRMVPLAKKEMRTKPPRKVPTMLPAVDRAYSRPTVAPDVATSRMRSRMM